MLFGKQVHRASPALAATRFLAEQLAHHLPCRHTGAQGMNVISVSAAEPVVLTLHRTDDAGADGFLAVVQMHEPEHLAPVVHLGALVLEAPTEGHVSIQLKTRLTVDTGALCRDQ